MATTTYEWQTVNSGFFVNSDSYGDQSDVAVAGMGKHGFIAAWSPGTDSYLAARTFDRGGDPASAEFTANLGAPGDQYDAALAGQPNGQALLAFTSLGSESGGGDIMGRLFRADGTPLGDDFLISDSGFPDRESDVAALADGGYVVSWTREFGENGDYDVRAQVVNANGTLRFGGPIGVDSSSTLRTDHSAVAGLAGGGFVVGWQQGSITGGTDTVAFRRYDSAGQPLDDNPVIIGDVGTVKDDLQIVGLADGGFAFAYADDSYGAMEISLRIYNADGSSRTAATLVNEGITAGEQDNPTITVLANGYIVVGWSDGDRLHYQAFDPDGGRVGEIGGSAVLVIEAELAGLGGGQMVSVRSSTFQDLDGDSIRGSIEELVRTSTGNGSNDTLTGDALADHFLGLGGKDKLSGLSGKDTLDGGTGDDVLRGGLDRDQLIGGAGADRYVYNDIAQSRAGLGSDTVKDFQDGLDKIDVEAIDAKAASPATDQDFKFIVGSFSAEGQVRAVQDGDDTLLQFNTTGAGLADMEIVLKNFDAGDISGADFVL